MRKEHAIDYPRRRVPRALMRLVGRLILPLAFRLRISGQENFPQGGPLIAVGNHRAAMEAVLMTVYTPWQVEMLGAADIPHERITQIMATVYGLIPVKRGSFDRTALITALDVLKQGGVVAVFPEGGIWNAGRMPAHTGVAWLSYRAHAPVLPIAFSGTIGALGGAMRLERPRLTMQVGQVMPAARLPEDQPRKAYLQAFAERTVEAIEALLPPDDLAHQPGPADERFALRVAVKAEDGEIRSYPDDLRIRHPTALAELLHRPAILKIFTINLQLPTEPLEHLDREADPGRIAWGTASILDYLREENPYLLTYRFGPEKAEAMRLGLEELRALARWATEARLRLELTPTRRYTSPEGEEVEQVKQGAFQDWM
jgi:1-acyl-sn-glycerol-3-phosphate acyltransferase